MVTKGSSRQAKWQRRKVADGKCRACGARRRHYSHYCDICAVKHRKLSRKCAGCNPYNSVARIGRPPLVPE